MLKQYLFCLMIFGLATQAGAGDTPLLKLDTADDGRGWEAVGRLEIGQEAFCTGSLIEEDLVLTAAHCLFTKSTGAPVNPDEIEFRAGWRNGRAEAYRRVRRAVVHPDYVFGGDVVSDRVRNDVALLQLDRPIRTTAVTPFETDVGRSSGQAVGIVSYAHDRADAPSLQQVCNVMGYQAGMLVTSCNVDFGSSGSPIFSFDGDQPRIVSVVSAKARIDGDPVALGTELSRPLNELRDILAHDDGMFLRAPVAGNAVSQDEGRRASGAKFVKP